MHIINKDSMFGDILITEQYTLMFYGLNTKYYSEKYIARIWNDSAYKEYQSSGIYVSCLISSQLFVCGEKRGCTLDETTYVITSSRNPMETNDMAAYEAAFTNVTKEVKTIFGNPYMTFAIHNIDVHFFTKLK